MSASQGRDLVTNRGNSWEKVKVKLASDLIAGIPALSSTDPEQILKFLIQANNVSDSEFVAMLVGRTSGRIMQILGVHVGSSRDWAVVQSEIVSTFLPPRVKERLLMSYVLDRFQGIDEDLNEYIVSVMAAAAILGFTSTEQQLVQCMLQNFHPKVRPYLLFAAKSQSVSDLFTLATQVAESVAVEDQREKLIPPVNTQDGLRPLASAVIRDRPGSPKADVKWRCTKCGVIGYRQHDCSFRSRQNSTARGSGSGNARRSAVTGRSRAPKFTLSHNIFYPHNLGAQNPFVTLHLGQYYLPAMMDTGSSLSFLRRDVVDNIKDLKLPYALQMTKEQCLLVNGQKCVITEAITLQIKIRMFSWKFQFFILNSCPIPCILGVNFLAHAKVCLNLADRRYKFLFHPEAEFDCESFDFQKGMSQKYPYSEEGYTSLLCGSLQTRVGRSGRSRDVDA
jgi:hypothetical protein